MPKVLIVEDDESMAVALRDGFEYEGYSVLLAKDGAEGLRLASEASPDLVILDVMLPDQDGFEVCRTIRKTSAVPIIMLTARGEVTDRIVGLELGADDYLPKPFEPRELVARIENILRRKNTTTANTVYRWGDLHVDLEKKQLLRNDQAVPVTATEFALLSLLVQNRDRVLSRDEIMHELRGIDADIYSRAIDVLVSRLRQKLQRPGLIRTVRGLGYQLVEQ